MKINNKGYAITLIVFGILIVFIVVLSTLLITMNNSVKLNKTVKESVVENIQLSADTSGTSLTERIEQLELRMSNIKKDTINEIYPVGSIYLSMNEEDLSTKFGGEWELIETGRTLLSAGTSTDESGNTMYYEVNTKGGSNYITINESNLPSHSHSYTPSGIVSKPTFTGNSATTGYQSANHTHSIPVLSGTAGRVSLTGNAYFSDNVGINVQSNLIGSISGIIGTVSNTSNQVICNTSQVVSFSHIKGISIDASHSHTVTTNVSTTGTNSVNHTHNVTASGSVSQPTFTGTASNTGSVGSGTSFSVQNPYITVYMYKRIN